MSSLSSVDDNLFIAQQGTIRDSNTIDRIRAYIFKNFKTQLENRETFHKYIKTMPSDFQNMINKVKHSDEITSRIC